MPNPHPTHQTTGKYPSRESLKAIVHHLRGHEMNWTDIGLHVGVSARTAKRCFEEVEANRKAARQAAYEAAQHVGQSAAVAPPSTLPLATKIYAALVIVMLILAVVAVFHG